MGAADGAATAEMVVAGAEAAGAVIAGALAAAAAASAAGVAFAVGTGKDGIISWRAPSASSTSGSAVPAPVPSGSSDVRDLDVAFARSKRPFFAARTDSRTRLDMT
jgi:hypothetical protein